jgi:Protein of unknown function (DUF3618)
MKQWRSMKQGAKMPSECERLEREVGEARRQLQATLEELRVRMTPAAVLDRAFEYGQNGRIGEILRNFARDVRENPLPLFLIGIGAAWLFFAASRAAQSVASSTAASAPTKATEIGANATSFAHGDDAAGNPERGVEVAAAAVAPLCDEPPAAATELDSSRQRP